MHPVLWLASAIGSEIIATVSLKLSDGFTKPIPSVVVVLGYGLSFYALSITLRSVPLGVFLFREVLDTIKVAGIGLIIIGVVMLNGAGATAH
jgi:small multidrug resistance pump